MGRRALTRTLLVIGLPLATLVAFACGDAGESTFTGGGNDSGSIDDTGPGQHIGGEGGADASVKANAVSIAWKPSAKTLTVDGKTPASQTYDLEATLKDGSKLIVLPDSVQFDRPDLATAKVTSTTTLTTPGTYAGTGTLHGVFGALAATASLTVVVARRDLNGVSTTIADALDAATTQDPGLSSLLYPYDKTVFALGLTSPKIMWDAPAAGDTYRFHLEQGNYKYDTYAVVAQPARFRLDQSIWDIITASNKGAGTGLTLKVSRYDAASKKAYASATETFTIAPESLRGAIYYWTASEQPGPDGGAPVRNGHISRFRPGTGAAPVALNNGKCMGCHAVNAKGTVLVGDIDDQSKGATDPSIGPYGNWSKTRPWASFDISNSSSDAGAPLKLETNKFGADIALNPDGTYVVFGGPTTVATGGGVGNPSGPPIAGSKYLSLAKVSDGIVIPTSGLDAVAVPGGMGMMMPAFSPDGTKMAVVVSKLDTDNVIPEDTGTSIQYLDFTQATPAFGPTLHPVVDGADAVFTALTGTGLAYPSFTPDSKAVAFHVGKYATGCNAGGCDDNTVDDGNLFVQPLSKGGVASPIAMKAASDPPNAAEGSLSVEPTFNPDVRGGYSWVVFTTMRTWGNQPFPNGTPAGKVNAKRRLWVAAVDTTIGAIDPSHPAFYLEGQEDTPNMRGFWANAVCTATAPAGSPPNACSAGYECCSGFCINKVCVDPSTVACAGIGESCTTAADCCNPDAVSCVSGKCKTGSIH
jgi:hypothetical protein